MQNIAKEIIDEFRSNLKERLHIALKTVYACDSRTMNS